MQSWLPLSPWQNSRDSCETSSSCQLQPVRNVFGACFWDESVFPFRNLEIFSGETEQLKGWGSTVSLTRPLMLSSHHIHAFCSANFPSLHHQSGLQTENLHSVGCLQPFSVPCSFSWLPRGRVVFLGAEYWRTALEICKSRGRECVCYLAVCHNWNQKAETSRAAERRGSEKLHLSLCHLYLCCD